MISAPEAVLCRVRAVAFDIGETIRDDSAEFECWADWLNVPRHTFSALVGAVRARGGKTDDAFQLVRPGFDLHLERERRRLAGHDEQLAERDLYPDVRTALDSLRSAGLLLGLAGNQSRRCAQLLRQLHLPVHVVMTSEEVGAQKPDPAFFHNLALALGCQSDEVLYVGDNWFMDVLAADAAGMATCFLRRGPWGYLEAHRADVRGAPTTRANGLMELVDHLKAVRLTGRPDARTNRRPRRPHHLGQGLADE